MSDYLPKGNKAESANVQYAAKSGDMGRCKMDTSSKPSKTIVAETSTNAPYRKKANA